MTNSVDIRAQIVDVFRRDLIGPGSQDADLATERLNESPSRWYLTGFLAPAEDPLGLEGVDDEGDPSAQEEMEIDVEEPDADGAGGAAGDNEEPEAPNTRRRFLPSSIGLTVLLDPDVTEIEARVSWGDYQRNRALPEDILLPEPPPESRQGRKPKRVERPVVDWVRTSKERVVRVPVRDGRGEPIVVPESAAEQRRGGGLTLETHSRLFSYETPDGKTERVRALTVFLVNRRATVHRFYADVSYAFQARLELICEAGFSHAATSPAIARRTGICASPICITATFANGRWAATPRRAGTRPMILPGCHSRLDRPPSVSRGRARRPERRRGAQGAGHLRHGDAGAAGRGRRRCSSAEPWRICRSSMGSGSKPSVGSSPAFPTDGGKPAKA